MRRGLLLAAALAALAACDSPVDVPPVPPDATAICIAKNGRCRAGTGECCGTLSCTDGICDDGMPVGEGKRCSSRVKCQGALTCDDGFCRGVSSCSTQFQECSQGSDCCGALFCGPADICIDGTSCTPFNERCTSSAQCCGTMTCQSGLCR